MDSFVEVTCPHCFQPFEISLAGLEGADEIDYDCEVCCRPLLVRLSEGAEGEVTAEASSLDT
jgi:hypothetical protein